MSAGLFTSLLVLALIAMTTVASGQACFKVITCDASSAEGAVDQHHQGVPGKRGPQGARGEKGSTGAGVDEFLTRIEALERRVAALTSPTAYEVRRTARSGSYDEARDMCRGLGGDLVSETLKLKNSNRSVDYTTRVLDPLMKDVSENVWIGVRDVGHEGVWTFLDGTVVEETVYAWMENQPNNHRGDQNCGAMRGLQMHDHQCDRNYFGLCEIPLIH